MSKGQKIMLIAIFIVWLLLMFYLLLIKDYESIIKSIIIVIGSSMLGIWYADLGGKDNE